MHASHEVLMEADLFMTDCPQSPRDFKPAHQNLLNSIVKYYNYFYMTQKYIIQFKEMRIIPSGARHLDMLLLLDQLIQVWVGISLSLLVPMVGFNPSTLGLCVKYSTNATQEHTTFSRSANRGLALDLSLSLLVPMARFKTSTLRLFFVCSTLVLQGHKQSS